MAENKSSLFWLEKAEDDFQYVADSYQEKNKHYSQILFFAHQAAEKYLKAYIVAFNLPFKKIHILPELLEICKNKDRAFEKLREACIFLNPFAFETRYPVHWPIGYTRKDLVKALEFLKEIRSFIKEKLA